MDAEKKINFLVLLSVIGIIINLFWANIYGYIFCCQLFAFLACKFPKRGSYGELPRDYPKECCCKPNFGKELFFYMNIQYGLPKEEIWKTWTLILWSLIYVGVNWINLILYTTRDVYIDRIFLIGIGGCVCISTVFDVIIRKKCFLNRYKRLTFRNFVYFFGMVKNIPAIIEYEEWVIVSSFRKRNFVDVRNVLNDTIYHDVFVEGKYLDKGFSVYKLYEICGLKYIVPQHLAETIKKESADWFVDQSGNQLWP